MRTSSLLLAAVMVFFCCKSAWAGELIPVMSKANKVFALYDPDTIERTGNTVKVKLWYSKDGSLRGYFALDCSASTYSVRVVGNGHVVESYVPESVVRAGQNGEVLGSDYESFCKTLCGKQADGAPRGKNKKR